MKDSCPMTSPNMRLITVLLTVLSSYMFMIPLFSIVFCSIMLYCDVNITKSKIFLSIFYIYLYLLPFIVACTVVAGILLQRCLRRSPWNMGRLQACVESIGILMLVELVFLPFCGLYVYHRRWVRPLAPSPFGTEKKRRQWFKSPYFFVPIIYILIGILFGVGYLVRQRRLQAYLEHGYSPDVFSLKRDEQREYIYLDSRPVRSASMIIAWNLMFRDKEYLPDIRDEYGLPAFAEEKGFIEANKLDCRFPPDKQQPDLQEICRFNTAVAGKRLEDIPDGTTIVSPPLISEKIAKEKRTILFYLVAEQGQCKYKFKQFGN